MSEAKKFVIETLGCKANWFDSEVVRTGLTQRGWVLAKKNEDIALCIVNSCTVTDEADRQSRAAARKLAKRYPNAKIVYTGCGSEVQPERSAMSLPENSWIISNREKHRLADWISELDALNEKQKTTTLPSGPRLLGQTFGYSELRSQHPHEREWVMPSALPDFSTSNRTRVFLRIQEGCDAFCTYCIIPYGRGPARSLTPQQILGQVRQLCAQGAREVVLTGTNLGDYGGKPESLEFLVRMILSETPLERLRLSSLAPNEIPEGLYRLMELEPRLCPHFHISLQSPNPGVLRRMKRRYGAEDVASCLNRIHSIRSLSGLRAFVGMDVITGFPGESEADFEQTVNALRALPWSRLHVFPYSEREGTPATRLSDSIPFPERKRRAKVLMQLSQQRFEQTIHARIQSQPWLEEVLVESQVRGPDGNRDWWSGYTPDYIRVLIPSGLLTKAGFQPDSYSNRVLKARAGSVFKETQGGDAGVIASEIILDYQFSAGR